MLEVRKWCGQYVHIKPRLDMDILYHHAEFVGAGTLPTTGTKKFNVFMPHRTHAVQFIAKDVIHSMIGVFVCLCV